MYMRHVNCNIHMFHKTQPSSRDGKKYITYIDGTYRMQNYRDDAWKRNDHGLKASKFSIYPTLSDAPLNFKEFGLKVCARTKFRVFFAREHLK